MRSLAFVLLQSQRKGSYLHDVEVSIASGRLRESGVPNDVFEVVLPEDDPAAREALLEELAARLQQASYAALVFQRVWDPAIITALRDRLRPGSRSGPYFLLARAQGAAEHDEPYDFVSRGLSASALKALAEAPEPLDPARIAGLGYRDANGELQDGPPLLPETPPERWDLRPNFQRVRMGPRTGRSDTRIVVYGNPGCPYRRPIDEVPFWRGLELDPRRTNTKGCSFCNVNLSEEYRVVDGIANKVFGQIAAAMDGRHEAREAIVLDQDPFPYLPELMRLLRDSGLAAVHVLIQARADLFLLRQEGFERALELARAGGHRLTPFLIGIENFHQPTLDLYNKGVTAETNVRVLEYLRGLGERFGDVYDPTRVAPGFVLWHPWVDFASLRHNLDAIARHRLEELRSELALSKIRLYPDIPFFWKAKADGLLVDAYPDPALDSAARYGYPEEAPYRFALAETQTAYTVLALVCRKHQPIHELEVLRLVLDWVERRPELWRARPTLAERSPREVAALFEAEHGELLRRLRKENNSAIRGEALSEQLVARLRALLSPTWLGGPGPGGFELAGIRGDEARVQLFFARPGERALVHHDPQRAAFRLVLEPRSDAPHFRHSARFNIVYSAATPSSAALTAAIDELSARIVERDRGVA